VNNVIISKSCVTLILTHLFNLVSQIHKHWNMENISKLAGTIIIIFWVMLLAVANLPLIVFVIPFTFGVYLTTLREIKHA
jgi:hypothetical protein